MKDVLQLYLFEAEKKAEEAKLKAPKEKPAVVKVDHDEPEVEASVGVPVDAAKDIDKKQFKKVKVLVAKKPVKTFAKAAAEMKGMFDLLSLLCDKDGEECVVLSMQKEHPTDDESKGLKVVDYATKKATKGVMMTGLEPGDDLDASTIFKKAEKAIKVAGFKPYYKVMVL
jgi:hypothetical protein